MFESCAQLWTFFYAFRARAVGPAEFRHRQHLAVALCYAAIMPPEDAHVAFRTDLRSLIEPWGQAAKYHETITRFWLGVAAHYLESQGRDKCLASIVNDFVVAFGDKSLIGKHYSPEVLMSPSARARWIAPDLAPIPR